MQGKFPPLFGRGWGWLASRRQHVERAHFGGASDTGSRGVGGRAR